MNTETWIFIGLVILSFVGLGQCFVKAGEKFWKGLVPIYNFITLSKLLNRPWYWALFMLVPVINMYMYGVYAFNLARALNKRSTLDLVLASFGFLLFIPWMGIDKSAVWKGLKDFESAQGGEKGFVKNWLDPIMFGLIAAATVRILTLELFTIPTSSLEKTLLVGDFLFVNKLSYGWRMPKTQIAFPLAHHSFPVTEGKAYYDGVQWPTLRLFGFTKPKNYDMIVFNYPDGDTVGLKIQNQSYYNVARQIKEQAKSQGATNFNASEYMNSKPEEFGEIVGRPLDKREFYVKRCVAIAGDVLEIKNGELFISGKQMPMPEKAQHYYIVKSKGEIANLNFIKDENNMYTDEQRDYVGNMGDTLISEFNMPNDVAEKMKQVEGVISVEKFIQPKGQYDLGIFPHDPKFPWNNDNFGPLTIPKAGATVNIDINNICLYDRIIDIYDDNDFKIEDGKIYINGVESKTYTFKQDYYFMMGDNRHNSADSRSWGFVPFDHIVGKPVFVFFSAKYSDKMPISGKFKLSTLLDSKKGKLRWDRFCAFVDEKGVSKSYLIWFAGGVAAIWALTYYRRKQQEKKSVK
jgi:signal peptidase I